ncbi:MAG TPA: XrtA/PEP-CTERM system histidine kinase PrsK [Burkholderiales bacterium]|nr:XrtA/PEP-CTERM system histidine kinase PrsK [Burkholderiales bacterium]
MNPTAFADPATWSYGFAALGFTAFAIQLALAWRGGSRAWWLLAAVSLGASWAAAGLGFVLTQNSLWWTLSRWLQLAQIAAWCVFLLLLATDRDNSRPWESLLFKGGLFALIVLLLGAGYSPSYPPADAVPTQDARFGYSAMVGLAILQLVLLEQIWRNAPEANRWALKPLCLGLGAAFIYNLYMYAEASLFGVLSQNLWSAHAATQALVIPYIAIAAARNKQWTIDIHMSRQVVFHSTALLGCGIYLLLASAIGYYIRFFGGSWGGTLQVALLFGALLLLGMLFSSGTLRSKLRVFVNKNFFSYRYDYREEWLRFTRRLSSREATANLNETSIQALADLVESPAGALWLRREGKVFRQVARWNMPAVAESESDTSSLALFLARTGWVVDVSQYRLKPELYDGLVLPDWMERSEDVWIVLPLQGAEELNGFVVLANSRVKLDINWEVLDLLKTAARQTASYLGHVNAVEALMEARKFDAFNRMSAFVVHDLKNLVAQLNLMIKNAERHRHNPEFQRDMMDTVQHVASRMNHLLMQLRAGATPIENAKAIDLSAIVRRVERAKGAGERLSIQVEENLTVCGHEERLEHVVGHLVQNALDATEAGGQVEIRVIPASDAEALLEVEDSGIGMSPEFVRERLFRPFQSTKPTGMGIGAYESAQYLQGIGARLQVQSVPGQGTRIQVYLPRPKNAEINLVQAA